jgi:hypothetical protein
VGIRQLWSGAFLPPNILLPRKGTGMFPLQIFHILDSSYTYLSQKIFIVFSMVGVSYFTFTD